MTKRDVLNPLSRVLLPVLSDSGQKVEMKQDTRKARRGCNLNRRWSFQIAMDMNDRMQCNTLQNSNHTSSIVQSSWRENFILISTPKIRSLLSDEAIPNFADRNTRLPHRFQGKVDVPLLRPHYGFPSPALATIRKIRAPDLVCPPWYCVHKKFIFVLGRFLVTCLLFAFYNCSSSASCIKICSIDSARRQWSV